MTHEYPDRDAWDNEDLGRKVNKFTVSAYVHGDDADAQAARLFNACNSEGPGSLSLPVRGRSQAICEDCTSDFSEDELGRIKLSLTFVLEPGERGGLVSFFHLLGAVLNTAKAATEIVTEQFAASYNAKNMPHVAREAATATIKSAVALIGAASQLPIAPSVAPKVRHEIRRLEADAYRVVFTGSGQDTLTQTVFSATERKNDVSFGARLSDLFDMISEATLDKANLAEALAPLTTFKAPVIHNPINVNSVRAERQLGDMVAALIRRLALIKWAEAMVQAKFRNRAEALAARAMLAERFEEESDDLLSDLRDRVIDHVTRNGAELPVVKNYVLPFPFPALVIAYELYGDAERDDELVARNSAPHPLVMPTEIEAIAA